MRLEAVRCARCPGGSAGASGRTNVTAMSDRIENVVIVGSGPAGYTAAEAVLQAVAGLLPLEEKPLLTTPGWQYREELLPEEAPR